MKWPTVLLWIESVYHLLISIDAQNLNVKTSFPCDESDIEFLIILENWSLKFTRILMHIPCDYLLDVKLNWKTSFHNNLILMNLSVPLNTIYSPPSITEIKKTWVYISTSPIHLHGMVPHYFFTLPLFFLTFRYSIKDWLQTSKFHGHLNVYGLFFYV